MPALLAESDGNAKTLCYLVIRRGKKSIKQSGSDSDVCSF